MYALEAKEMCKRLERICQVDPEGWYAPVIGEELIRCKDCKWHRENECCGWDDGTVAVASETPDDGFCYRAERRKK
jgi:hypothetical protein